MVRAPQHRPPSPLSLPAHPGCCLPAWLTAAAVVHASRAEGNFVFLFVGSERAILFDTGPIPYEPFKEAIAEHVPNAASLDLIVAHTHSHGDHIKGDPLWEAEAAGERDSPFRSVVVVGHSPQEVADFYSLDFAPDGSCEDATTTFHLGGGRELQLFWIRGHEDSHIAVYDEVTDVLVTGDVLYPGRLYVRDTPQFAATCQRMAAFVQHLPPARRDALRVLGCHIEMSSDGGEYETGTVYQPDEAKYEMTAQDVLDLASATSGAGSGGQTSGLAEGFDPNRRFMVVPPRL
jgi:hydroxyacylglutathione hydrolase